MRTPASVTADPPKENSNIPSRYARFPKSFPAFVVNIGGLDRSALQARQRFLRAQVELTRYAPGGSAAESAILPSRS